MRGARTKTKAAIAKVSQRKRKHFKKKKALIVVTCCQIASRYFHNLEGRRAVSLSEDCLRTGCSSAKRTSGTFNLGGTVCIWRYRIFAKKRNVYTHIHTCIKQDQICFQSAATRAHVALCLAVIYSGALPHYVPQLCERHVPLPRCLSRSACVCSSVAKVSRAAEGSPQPWAANWPGNVCAPVPPPTYPIVNQPDTRQGRH